MDDAMNQENEQQEVKQEVKEKKERKRRSPEERLALLMEQEKKAKEIAKNRSKAVKELQEKEQLAMLRRILKNAKAEGLTEAEFMSYLNSVSKQIIENAKNEKKRENQ